MRRREFIASLGGAAAAGTAALWRYVARAHRADRVRTPRTVNRPNVWPVRSVRAGATDSAAPT
jgi:hypothetical protein